MPNLLNAPLVEIVAEMRWPIAGQTISPGGAASAPAFLLDTGKQEDFFMRFATQASRIGYTQAERTIPHGMPLPIGQIAYRFKHENFSEDASLLQVGPGIFSANGVQPYSSWEEFRPKVKSGIELVLANRDEQEKEKQLSQVSLRYIDAFKPQHTQNRSIQKFLNEILKFNLTLPNSLARHVAEGAEAKPQVRVVIPAKDSQFNFSVAEGLVNSEQAIVMDMTVTTVNRVIPARIGEVMSSLDSAYEKLHAVFWDLTEPIMNILNQKQH